MSKPVWRWWPLPSSRPPGDGVINRRPLVLKKENCCFWRNCISCGFCDFVLLSTWDMVGGVLGAEILYPEPVNWWSHIQFLPLPLNQHRFNAKPWKDSWEQDRQSPCSHKQINNNYKDKEEGNESISHSLVRVTEFQKQVILKGLSGVKKGKTSSPPS